jgi:hypothetical protein
MLGETPLSLSHPSPHTVVVKGKCQAFVLSDSVSKADDSIIFNDIF